MIAETYGWKFNDKSTAVTFHNVIILNLVDCQTCALVLGDFAESSWSLCLVRPKYGAVPICVSAWKDMEN